MKQTLQILSDLNERYAKATADELYGEFVSRFGVDWAEKITLYINPEEINKNRKSFFEFYFDETYPLSQRSDPRSGMFVRDPKAEGGRIEVLLYIALGLEGFSQLVKIKRIINGKARTVVLQGEELEINLQGYEEIAAELDLLVGDPEAEWDDSLIRAPYESALTLAMRVLLKASKATTYDEQILFELFNVALCGAHCPQKKKRPLIGEKMNEVLAVAGAIRSAAERLEKTIE